ncbi:PQQ-dependent sugar dehydrogenase [Acetobacter sp.]|uniref:PQQ-dependent sugar dehydrogenase n=1 Tax=Acetobacter sp. TaxID=440 RepID=UPI0025C28064|nr:sorbosone dehydrogenase family protein [Acetobacter sp.]MCH4092687.1 sorbosone dehydrogenase family protein [Acetobacter sp.]MCI1301211.1 sorbosone dehydrogenase family protein [Acetobacter sp.]MCI1317472.1 sorbosone dehydrogenase family protein [Acetobacter sp.]
MSRKTWIYGLGGAVAIILIGGGLWETVLQGEHATLPVAEGSGPRPTLPAPVSRLVPTINVASPIGWQDSAHPVAAAGLTVTAYATGLDHPRWLYKLPNGDILVAESESPGTDARSFKSVFASFFMKKAGAGGKSPDRIMLLRDSRQTGQADIREVFLEHLHSPFGMALIGDDLYVANADAIVRFPYHEGETHISAPGEKIVDLPSGYNHHWTKNILAAPDGQSLFITVGSNSNVAENGMEVEKDRARILRLDLASRTLTAYATGLRNPNGLAWEPQTGALWVAVNERDEIGSDLVPDYVTSVKEGAFYGWPYSYYGQNVDVRVQPENPTLVTQAVVPDYAIGPHTASLGLSFSMDAQALPTDWRSGLFIAQHGSWNRRPKSGYRVIYVPFADGKPSGTPKDVLTGFLTADEEHVHGRPVGLALDRGGALLVADDVGNTIWRVAAASAQ